MAVKTLKLVEDNSAPPIDLTLKRDGTAINVTGCTVSLIITKGGVVTNTGHQTCTITGASLGQVRYAPQTVDFPDAGNYVCDIKVVYGDGTTEILYEQLKIKARRKLP